mmetsp:Transcript_272/g.445  ORF Transcript_272/g.445 Transcript_272/m.445 type:complete len:467 (+) Transcript_272:250-1650(+)
MVTHTLQLPTRTAGMKPPIMRSLFGIAPGWGLPCGRCCQPPGGLLPHRFTLTRRAAERREGRSVFCGAFRRIAPPGRYPAPLLQGVRTFLEHAPQGARARSHPALHADHGLRRGDVPVNPIARGEIRHYGTILCVKRPVFPRAKAQAHHLQQQIILDLWIAKGCGVCTKARRIHRVTLSFGPNRQPLARKALPIEPPTGIDLAPRCHVRMADHAFWRYLPPRQDPVGQEAFQRLHERFGKRREAIVVQLDPDGARVHIARTAPCAGTGVPGAQRLIDKRQDLAITTDQIMRRNLAGRIAQCLGRPSAILHRGVVDHHQFRRQAVAPFAEIRALQALTRQSRGVPRRFPQARWPMPAARSGRSRRRSRRHPGPSRSDPDQDRLWKGSSPAPRHGSRTVRKSPGHRHGTGCGATGAGPAYGWCAVRRPPRGGSAAGAARRRPAAAGCCRTPHRRWPLRIERLRLPPWP